MDREANLSLLIFDQITTANTGSNQVSSGFLVHTHKHGHFHCDKLQQIMNLKPIKDPSVSALHAAGHNFIYESCFLGRLLV